MERREDIRAAMHRLLSSPISEEAQAQGVHPYPPEQIVDNSVAVPASQLVTLRAVQAALRANQIEADIPDIVHAILEALATRPALCRGLVAAYLLGA